MLLYFTRILVIFLCFGNMTLNLLAQDIKIASTNATDSIAVVYLQDGSKFHGFLDTQNDSTTSVFVVGGNRLIFANHTIDHIEWIIPTRLFDDQQNKLHPVKMQFAMGTFLFNNFNRYYYFRTPISLEVNTLFRLKKDQPHYLGFGLGINYFSDQEAVFMPLFLSFQTELLPEKDHTPFYYADLGYSINYTEDIDNNWRVIEELDGIRYGFGVGLKNKKRPNTAWNVTVGYQYQRYAFEQFWVNSEETNLSINHLRRMKVQFMVEW
ncbi:MAG: hypothetical protein ACPGXL_05625 [Chitinophagales bacterium]